MGASDSDDGAAEFSAKNGEFKILSGLDGGVGKHKPAEANFATRAALTRIDSSSAAVNRFSMLETAVVAVAVCVTVVAVDDDLAHVSPDEWSTIVASVVYS